MGIVFLRISLYVWFFQDDLDLAWCVWGWGIGGRMGGCGWGVACPLHNEVDMI